MLESLNYSFRNPENIIWVIYRIKQLRNYKKTMGSSEDPRLVNNVDDLDLVYEGLNTSYLNKIDFSESFTFFNFVILNSQHFCRC